MGYPIRYEVYTCDWLTSNYVKCWTLFCSCRAQQLKIKLFNLITRTKLTSAVWRLSCRLARVWIVQKYKEYENATWKILKKIQFTINKQFWVDKCDIKMHVNNATSVDQWNYDSDRVCNLSLNFIEFFFSFFRNPRPSEQKRCESAREYLFECLRHSVKSHKLCGEEEEASVENELKITSSIDITNTKWTVHVHYINSLQIVVCLYQERGFTALQAAAWEIYWLKYDLKISTCCLIYLTNKI